MAREQIYHVIHRHIQCIEAGVPSDCHTILSGSTGSGKTHTITKALENCGYDIPIIRINATQLSPTAYKGVSFTKILGAAADKPNFDKAIIYIDEYDKIITNNSDSHLDLQISLQTEMLEILDNNSNITFRDDDSPSRTLTEKKISTANITIIISGVFRKVEVTNRAAIGFNTAASLAAEDNNRDHNYFISLGFMPELVYRFPYIISVEPYTREDYREILKTHFGLQRMKQLFGIPIDEEELLDFITGHKAGARSIQLFLAKKDLEYERKIYNLISNEEAE